MLIRIGSLVINTDYLILVARATDKEGNVIEDQVVLRFNDGRDDVIFTGESAANILQTFKELLPDDGGQKQRALNEANRHMESA